MMDLSNLEFPNWANWVAQDKDGAVWVYEVEPLQQHQGWYENEVGRAQKVSQQVNNPDWSTSLIKIN